MTPYKKLIVPLSLLVLAVLLRQEMIALYPEYGQLIEWLPYLGLGSAILLSGFFNLSRLFMLSGTVLAGYIVIQNQLQNTLVETASLYIYTSLSIIFPLLTLILLFVPEKGLRNRHGLLVCGISPLVALTAYLIYIAIPDGTVIAFINGYLPARPFNGYILSVSSSIFYVLVLVAAFIRLNKTNDDFIATNLVILTCTFITLGFFDQLKISTIVFIVAGIVLIISVLRSSYNLAYRDELTGLLGRRALNDQLKGLGKQYVIAMMDVDHFKKFNDKYGHNIGDDVLKMVAKKLEAVQGGGTAYRYGGEEFCILFPGKTLGECEPFLEVVRKTVENHRMTVRNTAHRPKSLDVAMERRGRRAKGRDSRTVSVTISIGVAERDGTHSAPEQVLKAADKALYRAKENGRNCLVMAMY